MKLLRLVAFALFFVAVESSVARVTGWHLARIDVSAAFLVWLAMSAPLASGALGAFAVGYVVDVLSGHPTGLLLGLDVFGFLMARALVAIFDVRSRTTFAMTAGGIAMLVGVSYSVWTTLTRVADVAAPGGWYQLPLRAILSALFAGLSWRFFHRVYPEVERQEPGLLRF